MRRIHPHHYLSDVVYGFYGGYEVDMRYEGDEVDIYGGDEVDI